MQIIQLLGSTLGLALMSGLNLYATVLTIGLGVRFNLITLPASLSGLSVLSEPEILIVAGILFIVESLVDKIPWLDSFWDSFHTIIRPVGAALIGAAAFSQVDITWQVLAILLCGGVSLSSHSSKAGTRLVANQSPEPFSNILLSVIEDIVAVGGSLFVLNHPIASLVIVAILVLLIGIFAPRLYRILRFEFAALAALIATLFNPDDSSAGISMLEKVPDNIRRNLEKYSNLSEYSFVISSFSGKGIKGGRNRAGYLCMYKDRLFFISRRMLGTREQEIDLAKINNIEVELKFLYGRVIFFSSGKQKYLNFLKNRRKACEKAVELIRLKISPQK